MLATFYATWDLTWFSSLSNHRPDQKNELLTKKMCIPHACRYFFRSKPETVQSHKYLLIIRLARRCHIFALVPFISGGWAIRHHAYGQRGLVENKKVSINVHIISIRFGSENVNVSKFHLNRLIMSHFSLIDGCKPLSTSKM